MSDDPSPGTADVAAFDAADAVVLARHLTDCLHAREWVDVILAGRPYSDAATLESAALTAAARLSDAALDEALAAHPRIGERPRGTGTSAAHSFREQAGVATDGATTTALRQANHDYEARFGRVFLVRAAGRTADEVLASCRARLDHDDVTEARVVREQLGQIAVLRLRALLADQRGTDARARA